MEHLHSAKGKKKLYNILARFIIEKIPFSPSLKEVTLIVDKSKNTREAQDFNRDIENNLQAFLPFNCRLYISHEHSHNNPGLQAVDMFCWGMARKFGEGDEWFNAYRSFVAFDTVYSPAEE